MWLGIMAAASVGLSAISAHNQSKKKNQALSARQAWFGEEKKYAQKMFEVQTFQKYFEKEQAGARRIALSAGISGSIGGARVLGQIDDIFLQTDLALDRIRHDHTLRRIDASISQLERGKTDPLKSAALAGFQGAVDIGLSMYSGGYFQDTGKGKK